MAYKKGNSPEMKFVQEGEKTLIYASDGLQIGWITVEGNEDVAVLHLHTRYCSVRLTDNDITQIIAHMEAAAYMKNPNFFRTV